MSAGLPLFTAPYAEDDARLIAGFLASPPPGAAGEARIDALATRLIEGIRAGSGAMGGIEDVLREYALTTREGLALMVLAEALLRVPDAATADRLIEDKLGSADFAHHEPKSQALLVNASAWALGLTARVLKPGETPEGIVAQLARRIGLPAVRTAARQAMKVMGHHFVLGETIEDALARASGGEARSFRYSFDMLGEGARTADDADRYQQSYAAAITAIGRAAGNERLPARPGISVKLSALHPRYEVVSRARVMAELVPRLAELARAARAHDLNFTVDAEEADRLELSLEVIAAVLADKALAGWEGFGLAVQAYQKRAGAVIDHVAALARALDRRLMVRLVKGAYWDTEVKRAQERGLADYPVFTRKPATDLAYLDAARKLLAARPVLYPQFATHNALTVAALIEMAGGVDGYEFQRLHGMGEPLYRTLVAEKPGVACRVYAPVGGHRDLLAYLVRRLLENGANTSFVARAGDPAVPVADLLVRPSAWLGGTDRARHPKLPLPRDLYGASRANSAGFEFGDRAALEWLTRAVADAPAAPDAGPLWPGVRAGATLRPVVSPCDGVTVVGRVAEPAPAAAAEAVSAATAGFAAWDGLGAGVRAGLMRKAADLLEARRPFFLRLLAAEAGKTLDDGIAEVREAVDFLRYYAAEAERLAATAQVLPGPTGESNLLSLRGRGVFACIAPWNFPLAIFVGQIAAALVTGNSVVAKPAPQTPLVAAAAVRLMHEAGVPAQALVLLPGDGAVGAALVADPRIAGVAFTGSTATARRINRALAAKDGPIVPFIAETGGLNAMIVDATALPEQVADDVVMSAFRSAGQRCSALRVLCVQADVAPRIEEMILGAARELALGDSRDPATHVGPVIDAAAKARLDGWIATAAREKRLVWQGKAPAAGTYVAPAVIRLKRVEDLTEEVFGPVLHVVRYEAEALDRVVEGIAASGYGLTLGIHSRIDETAERIIARLPVGNIYVNRNMIGAVVGTQPFGGSGLSGTGPKAGGPHYLPRFALEQVVATNTAAAGGNAALIAMDEG